MKVPGVDVAPVSPSKLLDAWEELGLRVPGAELWPEAVEQGTNDVLIARLGGSAIGSVSIMWNGPIRVDTAFRDVTDRLYPRERVPAVYVLHVQEEHRRRKVGRALMLGVEEMVVRKPEVARRIALSVEADNEPALALYEGLAYKYRQLITHEAPVWNPETEGWDSVEVQAWIMSKDLPSMMSE